MIITSGNIVLVSSILLFISVLAGKAGYKFGAPALLLFLTVGMLFGSDGLGIQFNSPEAAQFIGMIALSIILFSGGMDTKASEIKPVIGEGVVLATAGVALTATLTGLFIYLISDLFGLSISLPESFLLAAVMSSTDSASVFSILRSKKQGLKQNLRPLLELESGSNDPMAYILTVLLIQAIAEGNLGFPDALFMFFIQMVIGAGAGFLLGKLTVRIINTINIGNKSLYSVLLLALVFFTLSFTELIKGNGYLAVYIAGLVVGNHNIAYKKSLTTFFDGFSWLFQIAMFLTLGLLVNPHELLDVIEIGLLVGIFMILFARPIAVFLCLLPFPKISFKGRLYVSWVGLRGAVPIIFATYPLVAGLENAHIIFNTVFFITIISLLIQGTTVSYMANLLHLSTEVKEDSFGIDMPDEIKASLTETEVNEKFLTAGNTLKEIHLPPNTLVMMIRRGNSYIVPKGDTKLLLGDKILFISTDDPSISKEYTTMKPSRRKKFFKNALSLIQPRLATPEEILSDEATETPSNQPPQEKIGNTELPPNGTNPNNDITKTV